MYNSNMTNVTIRTLALLLIISVVGCKGSVIRYINPEANFSYIKKVAILPFNNMSKDRFAGERVRNTLTVELMSRGVFDVMERGEVSKVMGLVLRAAGFEEGSAVEVDKETLKLLGERLGVTLQTPRRRVSDLAGSAASPHALRIDLPPRTTSAGEGKKGLVGSAKRD